jgi:hypothetical protein
MHHISCIARPFYAPSVVQALLLYYCQFMRETPFHRTLGSLLLCDHRTARFHRVFVERCCSPTLLRPVWCLLAGVSSSLHTSSAVFTSASATSCIDYSVQITHCYLFLHPSLASARSLSWQQTCLAPLQVAAQSQVASAAALPGRVLLCHDSLNPL